MSCDRVCHSISVYSIVISIFRVACHVIEFDFANAGSKISVLSPQHTLYDTSMLTLVSTWSGIRIMKMWQQFCQNYDTIMLIFYPKAFYESFL